MVKMAWYYHMARGEGSRRKIIARRGAFHGSTVMAARISGLPAMHKSFNLPDCNVVHTTRPQPYRDGLPGENEAEFVARLSRDLETLIDNEGPETIAAFIAEPVMGAGGVITPPEGYLPAMQAIVRKYRVLYLSDEVNCGFGRTGNWFGCQTFGVEPDMMSIAKGLSSGYAPIGGVVVSGKIFEALSSEAARNGVFSHGFTYSGHPVSAAIAVEAMRIYLEMDLPKVATTLGRRLGELETAENRVERPSLGSKPPLFMGPTSEIPCESAHSVRGAGRLVTSRVDAPAAARFFWRLLPSPQPRHLPERLSKSTTTGPTRIYTKAAKLKEAAKFRKMRRGCKISPTIRWWGTSAPAAS